MIVKGRRYETIVTILANRILDEEEVERPFAVFTANGVHGLASLANSMVSIIPEADDMLIIGDARDNPEHIERVIRQDVTEANATVVVVVPGVEKWLGAPDRIRRITLEDVWKRAQDIPLTDLNQDRDFNRFKNAILAGAQPI